jgi:hypothetical protein
VPIEAAIGMLSVYPKALFICAAWLLSTVYRAKGLRRSPNDKGYT